MEIHRKFLLKYFLDIFYRTKDITLVSLVRAIDFADWGGFSVSVDGYMIANNHIWMMDANDDNLEKVTGSDLQEVILVFLPDGRYLQIGVNYSTTEKVLSIESLRKDFF